MARAMQQVGPRRDGPFITVNCGAISTELVESIFGSVPWKKAQTQHSCHQVSSTGSSGMYTLNFAPKGTFVGSAQGLAYTNFRLVESALNVRFRSVGLQTPFSKKNS
nr:sigma 54-interacting transcriptional regulator [Desulfonatronum thioautotrophicum]